MANSTQHRLSPVELRVLGCLMEKQRTTPDQYPLSLNSLRLACNQSSNREPVVHYEEATVAGAIESLRKRSLVRVVQQSGSRVFKYRHLVNETLGLVARQAAVLDVLMLRGPQTLGELKTRASRLTGVENLDEVETSLEQLIARTPLPLATQLERRPGQKEVRFAHLLSGVPTYDAVDAPEPAAASGRGPDRVTVHLGQSQVPNLPGLDL